MNSEASEIREAALRFFKTEISENCEFVREQKWKNIFLLKREMVK